MNCPCVCWEDVCERAQSEVPFEWGGLGVVFFHFFFYFIETFRHALLQDSDACDEELCGTRHVAPLADVPVKVKKSGIKRQHAGNGLFIQQECAPKTRIGSFGGELQCGDCVRKRTKQFTYFALGTSYIQTQNPNGISWHFVRTGDQDIDGPMWFINSSRLSGARGYKYPNVFFETQVLLPNGVPDLEVYSGNSSIPAHSELLAQYI
jgi:hypothetical protein